MLPVSVLLAALVAQAPTISVTTRLVEVSVVAHDKHGKPVADLSADDFVVLENGRPQTIRVFVKEAEARPGVAQRAGGPALPANVFSNRGGSSDAVAKPSRMTVVLFDALNTPWQFRNFAGKHLDRFVKSMPADEPVSVLLLSTTGLRLLHGDKSYRLPQFQADQLLTGNGETAAEQLQADNYTGDRVRVTLRALERIAENLAGVSGRKNLVWITGGIPTVLNSLEPPGSPRDRRNYRVEYRHALLALNRASVAVYPVDARGLEAIAAATLVYGAGNPYTAMPSPTNRMKYQEYRTGMQEVANGTGGKAYFDRNDLDKAATDAVEDARVSYTIAYYQPDEPDDKWRKIDVRVKRDGVAVRHRTGYLAVKDDRANDAEAALRRALSSPLDATAIGLNGAVERQADGKARALLQIDPSNVAFTPEGQGYRVRLQVVTMVRDQAGNPAGKTEMDGLDLPLEGENLRNTQTNGVLFRKEVAVAESAFEVRFAVRDRVTGLVGSLSIPLR